MAKGTDMARDWSLVGAILLALLLAWWTESPGMPRGADAPATRFSAARAMRDVAVVGSAPHVLGSTRDARVAIYLAHRLAGLGLAAHFEPVPVDDHGRDRLAKWSGRTIGTDVTGANVVGILPGRDPAQPAVLLMAHHDTVWGSPGAADDTAGVATILETLRALRTGPQPARDVIVLLTDGEEIGLEGAHAFFEHSPLRAHVGVVVNLEARGAGGRAQMFETGVGNGAMMRTFARAVPWPSASSLSVLIYRTLPNDTDLTVALNQGYPGFNFAFIGRAGLYHSPLATPARMSAATLQDLGQQALGLTRALAYAPVLPPRAPDAVFSDVWGSMILLYPAWGGWVVLGAALLLGGGAAWRVARDRSLLREGAKGLLVPLALVPMTALPLFLLNRLSGAGPGHNYYDRLAALPRLEEQAALIAGAALLLLASFRWTTRWGGWIGLFAVMLAIGVAVQVVAPGAGPILHWPLLLAAAAMAVAAWLDPTLERAPALALVALLAAAGTGEVLAYLHFAFLAVGAVSPEELVALLLPLALLVWPLLHHAIPARAGRTAALAALAVAVALALWVKLDPIAPSTAIYSIDKQ